MDTPMGMLGGKGKKPAMLTMACPSKCNSRGEPRLLVIATHAWDWVIADVKSHCLREIGKQDVATRANMYDNSGAGVFLTVCSDSCTCCSRTSAPIVPSPGT
mmetsp:Transcript_7083/g.13024  ORF Transcript_7083/g.13024 Transcript_7083/m.13024 type:complete len:102 (+) Transcript_7083:358-663(+)